MYSIELIKQIKNKFITLVKSVSIEDANKIPEKFSNNIVWNYGHAIVSAYSLTYVVTHVEPHISIPFADKYRKGTKPELSVDANEIEQLEALSNAYFEKVAKDIVLGKFNIIKEYTTQTFGLPMNNIEEVLITIAAHDVAHYSTALAIKKFL